MKDTIKFASKYRNFLEKLITTGEISKTDILELGNLDLTAYKKDLVDQGYRPESMLTLHEEHFNNIVK